MRSVSHYSSLIVSSSQAHESEPYTVFSESSTGRWTELELRCCPSKQGELSENILQNLFLNLPPQTVQRYPSSLSKGFKDENLGDSPGCSYLLSKKAIITSSNISVTKHCHRLDE